MGKKGGNGSKEEDRGTVIVGGQKFPTWNCIGCQRKENWQCRTKCRCGRPAPPGVLALANADGGASLARPASQNGERRCGQAKPPPKDRPSSASVDAALARVEQMAVRLERLVKVVGRCGSRSPETARVVHQPWVRTEAKVVDSRCGGRVAGSSLQAIRDRLAVAEAFAAGEVEGSPSHACAANAVAAIRVELEGARPLSSKLQSAEAAVRSSSCALQVAKDRLAEKIGQAAEVQAEVLELESLVKAASAAAMADLAGLAELKKDMELQATSDPASMVDSIVKVGVLLENHGRGTGDQTCMQVAELLSKLVAQLAQGATVVAAGAQTSCPAAAVAGPGLDLDVDSDVDTPRIARSRSREPAKARRPTGGIGAGVKAPSAAGPSPA